AARDGADEDPVPRQAAPEGVAGDAGTQEPGARQRSRQARALGSDPGPDAGAAGALTPQRRRAEGLARRSGRAGRDARADEPPAAPRRREAEEAPLATRTLAQSTSA